jgi:DNA-binding SARP family transcriptional activator
MFLYLLFMGPQEREAFSLAFWPDSHPQQVRRNFHTTLYRARHALGENAIVFSEGLYQVNPDLDLWCDAHQLEDLVCHARPMPPRDARTEDLWRRAVDLYHGDFLPSVDAEWVDTMGDTLRDLYLEALIGLGECALARDDLRDAIQAFNARCRSIPTAKTFTGRS